MFLMLCSINWPNFIAWLPLLVEILPGCDVISSEISLIFLMKLFFDTTENSRQKFKYLENKKRFYCQKKAFFVILKGRSVAKMPQT